jgi:integrase
MPPLVKRVRSGGQTYYYFRSSPMVRLPDLRSIEFGEAYARCMGAKSNRERMKAMDTVASVVALYEKTEFAKKSAGTRRTYGFYLARLVEQIGNAPVRHVERADVRKLLEAYELEGNLGAANLMLAVTNIIFKFALSRDMIGTNPCKGIERHQLGGHDPWPVSLVELGLRADEPLVRKGVALLYFTAQRIGDVCRMRWADTANGLLRVTQEKTGKPLTIPMHSRLVSILGKPEGITLLGQPIGTETLRRHIKAWARQQGHEIVPHGLRKNAVTALLEAGCSVVETAAISGQSQAMVEYYSRSINQEAMAGAAILKWENRTGTGK